MINTSHGKSVGKYHMVIRVKTLHFYNLLSRNLRKPKYIIYSNIKGK